MDGRDGLREHKGDGLREQGGWLSGQYGWVEEARSRWKKQGEKKGWVKEQEEYGEEVRGMG